MKSPDQLIQQFALQPLQRVALTRDQIKIIQDDALNSLLNRLYAPTLKFEGKGDDVTEMPMTVDERIEYVLGKEKALTQVKIKLNALAAKKAHTDDPDFMVYDWSGGNIDDAYALGSSDGEVILARELKDTLDS